MKKSLFIIVACLVSLIVLSCITTKSIIPLVYTNNQNTEFEILGTFTYKSISPMGYVDIYNIAKTQYPATDFVIDIVIDQHVIKTSYHIIVFLLKQIFSADFGKTESVRYEYVMRGTAIRYVKKNYEGQVISIPTETSANPAAPARTNVDVKSPSVTEFAEKYTVTKVIGNPQWESMGTFVYVKVGDVLTYNTNVRIPMNSSIVLNDGKKNIVLEGIRIGKVSDIIMKL